MTHWGCILNESTASKKSTCSIATTNVAYRFIRFCKVGNLKDECAVLPTYRSNAATQFDVIANAIMSSFRWLASKKFIWKVIPVPTERESPPSRKKACSKNQIGLPPPSQCCEGSNCRPTAEAHTVRHEQPSFLCCNSPPYALCIQYIRYTLRLK